MSEAAGSAKPIEVINVSRMYQKYSERLFNQAADLVAEDIAPIDDVRSTAAYRMRIASLLVREALQEAWKRAGGKK